VTIMDDRPWLDIGTLAIARMSIGDCIPAFLHHMEDREELRLRWICHLDQYGAGGLETLWKEQAAEILKISDMFDDFLLIATRSHVGYGGGLLRILREVHHGMIYLDDDQFFVSSFRASDAINSGCDYYSWSNCPPGATLPSYWSLDFVAFMAKHFPQPARETTERHLMYIAQQGGATSNRNPELNRHNARRLHKGKSIDLGVEYTQRRGAPKYSPNSVSQNEAGDLQSVRRSRPWENIKPSLEWVNAVSRLLQRYRPVRFLELCVGDGETARQLYFHARESNDDHYVGIGTWNGLNADEYESRAKAKIYQSWGRRHGIVVLGNCRKVLSELQHRPRKRLAAFDLIIVNGPYGTREILSHSAMAWPLLREYGIMIWPNTPRDQLFPFTEYVAGRHNEAIRAIGQYAVRRTAPASSPTARRRR